MNKNKNILWITLVIFIVLLFLLIFGVKTQEKEEKNSSTINNEANADNIVSGNAISGFAVHPIHTNFNSPMSSAVVKYKYLAINDSAVYKLGYYSVNGSSWQIFNFSGTAYSANSNWLRNSGVKTLPDFGVGEHYIIVYSCNNVNGSWDCHDNKWQLLIVNNTAVSCGDDICGGDEYCSNGVCLLNVSGNTYFVALWGNDSYPGTFDQPFYSWQRGVEAAYPGDIVYIRGGTWYPTKYIGSSSTIGFIIDPTGYTPGLRGGEAGRPIRIFNYPGERPILDGSLMSVSNTRWLSGISIGNIEYIYLRGLTVSHLHQSLPDYSHVKSYSEVSGIGSGGANHHFENMIVHDIDGRGFQHWSSAWSEADAQYGVVWCIANAEARGVDPASCQYQAPLFSSDNTSWINCDAYNLYDRYSPEPGNAADGWKVGTYSGSTFTWDGCRAWNYSDDGFDPHGSGKRIFENCWAMSSLKYVVKVNTCVPLNPICVGSPTQSCVVANGTGVQSRICYNNDTNYVWSPFSDCVVSSCNLNYEREGNSCVPSACSGSSSRSCTIANGVGTQFRSCNSGAWSEWEGYCFATSCNSGYYKIKWGTEGNGFKTTSSTGIPLTEGDVGVSFKGCIAAYNIGGSGSGSGLIANLLGDDDGADSSRPQFYNNFAYHNSYGYRGRQFGDIKNNVVFDSQSYGPTSEINELEYAGQSLPSKESNNTWYSIDPRVWGGSWPWWEYNSNFNVTSADFVSLDYNQLTLPRKEDGSLPDITFGHLRNDSDLIDAGTIIPGYHCATSGYHSGEECREWFGDAPDLGPFEYEEVNLSCSGNSSQSCSIINTVGSPITVGAGTQIRTCNNGVWSAFGTCNVASCYTGFVQSGNTCVPTCTDSDGGQNLTIKGAVITPNMVTGVVRTLTDTCFNQTGNTYNCSGQEVVCTVYEYYCTIINERQSSGLSSNVCANGCRDGACLSVSTNCSGSSTQSCSISNGVGSQSRTCSSGVWSSWGTCGVVSCNSGYVINGSSCSSVVCSGNSSQSCSISNGAGVQNRTCSLGNWSAWGTCTRTSCNSGYTACGNGCNVSLRSCSVTNGVGTQTGYCSSSSWYWNACSVASCNSGYIQSGNTCIVYVPPVAGAALIINSSHTNISKIPLCWIERAKNLTFQYAHRSDGNNIFEGLSYLQSVDSNLKINKGWDSLPAQTNPIGLRMMDGNPPTNAYSYSQYYWSDVAGRTATYDNWKTGKFNGSMWSWCDEMEGSSLASVQYYLDTINMMEANRTGNYSNLKVVYMTGYTQNSNSVNLRNNEYIRNYSMANRKILYDFEDIGKCDPNGNCYSNADRACTWCTSWCTSHPADCVNLPSCSHAHGFICVQRGKAFWWMMARFAGWDGVSNTCS